MHPPLRGKDENRDPFIKSGYNRFTDISVKILAIAARPIKTNIHRICDGKETLKVYRRCLKLKRTDADAPRMSATRVVCLKRAAKIVGVASKEVTRDAEKGVLRLCT
jgi:hypothetical protein